ncbi:Zinc knuckle CX2CX4HX4C [Sesbania bispinosa]|nr:Zinc knuckle CX2CX4HX4C [Sesbania bispinosa]
MQEDNSILASSMEGLEVLLEVEGDAGIKAAQRMLVGRVMTEKSLNRAAVKEILAKAWGLLEDLNISDLGPNVFLFNFKEAKQARKAMDEGPWFVMGHLLSLQHWIPKASVFEVNYDWAEFWVQLHNLPLEFMSDTNAVKVAKLLGDIIMIENPFVDNVLLRLFLRIKVRINIKRPLLTGFWLPRKDLPRVWIFIKYERLQGFIYNCGIVGHDFRKCRKEKEMAVYDNTRPRYGATLGVPPAKSLAAIAAENANRIRRMKTGDDDESAQGANSADKKDFMPTHSDADTAAQQGPNIGTHSGGQQNQHCKETSTTTAAPDPTPNHMAEKKGPVSPRPITLIDLEEGRCRPGLGPTNVDDLGVQLEFIGLKNRVIITDYPSPTIRGTSKYGVELTEEEISKFKSSRLLMPQKKTNTDAEAQHAKQNT